MSKGWKIFLSILCILVFIVGILSILSHAVYHRSLMASGCEWFIGNFRDNTTDNATVEELEAKMSEPEPEFVLEQKLKSPVTEGSYQNLKIYTLNENEESPILVYIHGGAYVRESTKYHWRMLDKLSQQSGCEIRSIHYPLTPWHTWEDSYPSITQYYLEVKRENPERMVYMGGDSAGGGLALGVAINITNEGNPAPDGLILLSPWVETTETNPDIPPYEKVDPMLNSKGLRSCAQVWAGDEPLEDWHISPINGNLSQLKNVHLFVGTREMFYPDVTLLYQKLQELGVESYLSVGEGMNHVFQVYPTPEGKKSISEIADLLSSN